jgi:heat shock protein HslJ
MKPLILTAAFVLIASVAAGNDTPPLGAASNTPWVLTMVDGAAPRYSVTLSLAEPGMISGQGPCNRFSGPVARVDASFVVGELATTRMACADLAGEVEFLALLAGIKEAKEMPGLLILTGDGHEIRFGQPIN